MSVPASNIPLQQETIFGTTAWAQSYGRRNRVETANAQLKGGFVNIRKGFHRSLDSTKINFLLIHTLVGYNIETLTNWERNQRALIERSANAAAVAKRGRRKGSLPIYADVEMPIDALRSQPETTPRI